MARDVHRGPRPASWALPLACASALVVALSGCDVPVLSGVDEAQANLALGALDRAGVAATKETDARAGDRFAVTVARDQVGAAIRALAEQALPQPEPVGLASTFGAGALVPSFAAERAQYVAATASELEKTLDGVDGVVRARVHLDATPVTPLVGKAPPAKASVLVEHRPGPSPLPREAVQQLVAGAVSGLAPADVAVVLTPRAVSPPIGMARLGPFAVSQTSVRALQFAFAALLAAIALLSATTLVLCVRRVRRGPPEPRG
jgi:type III secretion protein J